MSYSGKVAKLSRLAVSICLVTLLGSLCVVKLELGSSKESASPPDMLMADQKLSQPQKKLPLMSLSPSAPKRLVIEKLGVNAPVEKTGLTDKGDMQAPDTPDSAGWYRYGYLPGALGSAVVAAHSWHKAGEGVFSRLEKLEKGDQLQLVTDATVQTYEVEKKQAYPAHAEVPEVFTASDKARLNLITCVGDWLPAQQSYTHRFVVYTTFVKEQAEHVP